MDEIVMLAMASLNEKIFADRPPPQAEKQPPVAEAAEGPARPPDENPLARGIVESVLRGDGIRRR